MATHVPLSNWRFLSFLAAQFLGAFNDNAFKLVVSLAALSFIADATLQQSYLAATSALAILPYLLFSGYAGYLGDRYAKSNVLRISKAAEILAMLAAVFIFLTGQNITHLLVTLFLLALHSAFFSPSKYGILPEIMSPENLPKANGYLNMLTFLAIILGSVSGAQLWGNFKETPEVIGYILTGVAVVGTVLCMFVPNSNDGNTKKQFKLNPFAELYHGFAEAVRKPILLICMAGSATFWMLGGMIYLALLLLGKTQLGLDESASGTLFAFLATGIAVGSVLAGYVVGKTVHHTVSVVGGFILSIGCFLTGFFAINYAVTAALVTIVGIGGGLFIVPVATLLQKNSSEELRGQLLATSGFCDMGGVFVASGLFWLFGTQIGLSPSGIIMAAGGISLAGTIFALVIGSSLPQSATGNTLGERFIVSAKQRLFAKRMSDTTGARMTGLKSLVAARLLSKWIAPRVHAAQHIAVLIPASVAGALVNFAIALLGKTSVNLNFSLGSALLEDALKKAEIETIITSRKVIQKLKIEEDARMVFIEEALAASSALAKLSTMLQAMFLPRRVLLRLWLRGEQKAEATATILFSSGSTAAPKAIMLSHANLLSNIDGVDALLAAQETKENTRYVFAGILPFFHSFGLTACLWLPAVTGRRIAYHANPLESKTVAKMIGEEACQFLIATPTFARHYIGAAKPKALDSLRFIILGGEKLTEATQEELQTALPQAYVLQGYGCTELGPVVAINLPDDQCQGSVGKPIPRVEIRIEDRETHAELKAGEEGLVLVKSPSRMQGYYHDKERTEEALRDGWYITGDIGKVDADGFLHITDRVARFSKLAGEMVPHGKIEDALAAVIDSESAVTVVAVPQGQKGETLVILTTEKKLGPKEIYTALKQQGLPNLWVPAAEHIFAVDEVPTLATGKRDLQASRKLAEKLMHGETAEAS